MNIAIEVVQVILAFVFIMSGAMKALLYENARTRLPWVKDLSMRLVVFIGIVELLGAIGLIIPNSFDFIPILTPIAAIGLALIMILAAGFHAKRKEYLGIVRNIIILAMTLFVVIGHMG